MSAVWSSAEPCGASWAGVAAEPGVCCTSDPAPHVVLTGPTPSAVTEATRFGGPGFTDPRALLRGELHPDVIVIDEAAQLPVPLLERLVRTHPRARLAFATTTHGYEGTGRGFVLRFLRWLDDGERDVARLSLTEPIRWSTGDPLEALIRDVLLLDAQPARLPPEAGTWVHAVLDREDLARDERVLTEVVGLLVHAHYRTTPGDVHRLLDAPNLTLHVLFEGPHVVAIGLRAPQSAEHAMHNAIFPDLPYNVRNTLAMASIPP